jgi:hypothetical protein
MTGLIPRRTATAVASLLLAAGLTACAAPDPQEVTDSAERVFDDLVSSAAELDAELLRTWDVAPPEEITCADPEDTRQTVLVATGTLAVQAAEGDSIHVFEAVDEQLRGERWDAIRVDRTLTQRAWADDQGIVVSVTAEGSVVTVAVFTPCLR